MKEQFLGNSLLFGSNAPFIEAVFEDYLNNPALVSMEWRNFFEEIQQPNNLNTREYLLDKTTDSKLVPTKKYNEAVDLADDKKSLAVNVDERKQIAVLQLINAHRYLGVYFANLDPLGCREKRDVPELEIKHYGLTDEDLDKEFNAGSFVGPERASLRQILHALRQTYCNTVGVEYMYMANVAQKRWIQSQLESKRSRPTYSAEYKRHILERLNAAEILERYLHTRYVGQKRFSGEGNESLIPILHVLSQRAGRLGVQEIVIGMAHRARLNVLVNVLGKMPSDLFKEFEGTHIQDLPSGDVKYHQGFSSAITTPGGIVRLTLAFNPSHLEIVDPVVEGSVRARQHRLQDKHGDLVLPVLLHGDAAFAGQGVVMETLNLSQTRGYGTGGTVHVIINNQIGFTTSDLRDTRSTQYCTDVAKMIEAPILHVNGDDPEAVAMVTEMALDFRMQFHKDVIIDLVCYRRMGHNEQDDPLVTQPAMYQIIKKHPTTRQLYADQLESEGVIEAGEAEAMIQAYREAMDNGINPNKTICYNYKSAYSVNWARYLNPGKWNQPVKTGILIKDLKQLALRLTDIPTDFKLHPRVEKIINDRRLMSKGEMPLDWGMAESLAYAGLLKEGVPVRLSGQDSGRGTFFHRHAVLHDQNREQGTEGICIPLRNIIPDQPNFTVINSMLSEEAVLAFEYGYTTAQPNELVVWEAQFGDFANGAQVVIDQFITSGEAKWGRLCGLVMMLPHGYEGQGPEHSSARLERYLQLCSEYNIQVCVPSTPAQIFHLLRRQIIRPLRKPLIIMTPKSLLRHKESTSTLDELAKGCFQPVIPEMEQLDSNKVRRVIACSGKIYYELMAYRREREIKDMAVIRLEQLYPFPHDDFQAEIDRYNKAKEIIWCQEEPGNQGAWHRIQHYLLRHMRSNQVLNYALRPSSASPAAGYLAKHKFKQNQVIEAAFREKI